MEITENCFYKVSTHAGGGKSAFPFFYEIVESSLNSTKFIKMIEISITLVKNHISSPRLKQVENIVRIIGILGHFAEHHQSLVISLNFIKMHLI